MWGIVSFNIAIYRAFSNLFCLSRSSTTWEIYSSRLVKAVRFKDNCLNRAWGKQNNVWSHLSLLININR